MAIAVRPTDTEIQTHEPFEPLDIAGDRCKGCGLCADVCPKHILALDESIVNDLGQHLRDRERVAGQLASVDGITTMSIRRSSADHAVMAPVDRPQDRGCPT